MAQSELIEQLLRLNDNAAQRDYLQEQRSRLTNAVVKELKDRAIQLRLQDAQGALALSALIAYAAELTGCATHEGYALWAEAVIRSLELAEFQVALTKYDRAIAIFRRANDEVSQAIIQISRLWSLESLGRHEEAFAAATWAGQILEANAMWLQLGTLTMNVGLIHNRLGNDQKALEHFEQTLTLYQRAGAQYEVWWAQAEHNRSLALRNLGRFEESLAACRNSLAIHQKLGNSTEVARAQQNLGVT
ncbi:MAG: tetratricopeptide repeat protein, partial [Caldilineaceae bacterium]|nr:tetratricopeptide repeat protein [Caldilineaceae bacterium]